VVRKQINLIMENKLVPIELDMSDWDREGLYFLIRESCEKNISVNQVIEQIIAWQLEHYRSQIEKQDNENN